MGGRRPRDSDHPAPDHFAGKPVKVQVYQDCQHGCCVSDGRVYKKAEAKRALAELIALYAKALV